MLIPCPAWQLSITLRVNKVIIHCCGLTTCWSVEDWSHPKSHSTQSPQKTLSPVTFRPMAQEGATGRCLSGQCLIKRNT